MRIPKRCCDYLLDIFYPNRCPSCGKVIAWNMRLCDDCLDVLPYIENYPWQSLYPHEINGEAPAFDYANSLFWYEGTAQNAVLTLKSGSGKGFAEFAAERIVLKLESDGIALSPDDIVTAVPMSRRRRLERGYNQAELFADNIAEILKVKADFKLLHRRYSKLAQHELGRAERLAAADEQYCIKDKSVKLDGKNVLLCDDIFTSGATVDKCSALLKEMGADKVYAVTVCRTSRPKKNE